MRLGLCMCMWVLPFVFWVSTSKAWCADQNIEKQFAKTKIKFDQQKWLRLEGRKKTAFDLIDSRVLKGLKKDQVHEMLGKPFAQNENKSDFYCLDESAYLDASHRLFVECLQVNYNKRDKVESFDFGPCSSRPPRRGPKLPEDAPIPDAN
jgi:hypothetical protein